MGLTSFSGDFPAAKDILIAKNYLSQDELSILNRIVSGYFDFAEVQAMRHHPMYMSDYVKHLNNILSSTGEKYSVMQAVSAIRWRRIRQTESIRSILCKIHLRLKRSIFELSKGLKIKQRRKRSRFGKNKGGVTKVKKTR